MTGNTEQKPNPLSKTWQTLQKTNWFMRGALGAFPILAFFEQIFPLDKVEILRALHAIVLSWNELVGRIGAIIGKLPLVPELPVWLMNGLAIYSLLVLGNIGHRRSAVYWPNKFPLRDLIYIFSIFVGTKIILQIPEMRGIGYIGLTFGLLGIVEDKFGQKIDEIVKPLWFLNLILSIFYLSFHQIEPFSVWYRLIILILAVWIGDILIATSRPPLRKGILFSFGLIIVFISLHLANLPVVKNFVMEKTDAVLCDKNQTGDCKNRIND